MNDARKMSEGVARFLEICPDALAILGSDGRFIEASAAWLELFDRSPADLVEQAFIELIHPDDRRRVLPDFKRMQTDPTTMALEIRFRETDGNYEWLDCRLIPDLESGRIFLHARAIHQKHTFDPDEEVPYRQIFEDSLDGIYQTTPEGCFIMANDGMARLLGCSSPEELIETITDIRSQLFVTPTNREESLKLAEQEGTLSTMRKSNSIAKTEAGSGSRCRVESSAIPTAAGITMKGSCETSRLKNNPSTSLRDMSATLRKLVVGSKCRAATSPVPGMLPRQRQERRARFWLR